MQDPSGDRNDLCLMVMRQMPLPSLSIGIKSAYFLSLFFTLYFRATRRVQYKKIKVNLPKYHRSCCCDSYPFSFMNDFLCLFIAVSIRFMVSRLHWSIKFSSYVSMRWSTKIISWNLYVNKTKHLWILISPKEAGMCNSCIYNVQP